jgi:hypothetical protein
VGAVVIVMLDVTVSANVFVAVAEALSATVAVKLKEPDAVGLPLIRPPELMFNPAGKEPPVTDHV